MAFDPTLPVEESPLDAAEMREQFNGLKGLIDDLQSQIADLRAHSAIMPNLTVLDTPFSSPPVEADLEVIRNYVNDMASQLQGGW